MPDIIFWQNMVSPHQSAFLTAVAKLHRSGEVQLICQRRSDPKRLAQGWSSNLPQGVEVINQADEPDLAPIIDNAFGKSATHVFSGIHETSLVRTALPLALKRQERAFVLAEQPNTSGHAGFLKRLLYATHAMRLRNRLSGVFAYGEQGVRFFEEVGFASDRVFEIGYTVDQVAAPQESRLNGADNLNGADETCRLLFVGTNLRRKGFDLLRSALLDIGLDQDWRLDVVTADNTSEARRWFQTRGLSQRVTMHGAISNCEVRALMRQARTLILPSRFDGWGAVVNEALHAGMRVIVSDRCGSSSVVRESWRGQVFPANDLSALTRAIHFDVSLPAHSQRDRDRISIWADATISAQAMAKYFLAVQSDPGLLPPWRC